MKEFKCGVLVPECWATFHGESDDEILRQVIVHAREEHGMDQVPPEVVDDIVSENSEREWLAGAPVAIDVQARSELLERDRELGVLEELIQGTLEGRRAWR